MNRQQRFASNIEWLSHKKFESKLRYSTTFVLAAVVLAMDKSHCKVNWDRWFKYFVEIYPELLNGDDPTPFIKKAEDIIGGGIEIEFDWK